MEPDAVELRILGCLIEKQRTTPDAYPLTSTRCGWPATSRRTATRSSTTTRRRSATALNRLVPPALDAADERAGQPRGEVPPPAQGGARARRSPSSRCWPCLLLRGPQTPGELNQRAARLHPFAGLPAIDETLERLIARGLARAAAAPAGAEGGALRPAAGRERRGRPGGPGGGPGISSRSGRGARAPARSDGRPAARRRRPDRRPRARRGRAARGGRRAARRARRVADAPASGPRGNSGPLILLEEHRPGLYVSSHARLFLLRARVQCARPRSAVAQHGLLPRLWRGTAEPTSPAPAHRPALSRALHPGCDPHAAGLARATADRPRRLTRARALPSARAHRRRPARPAQRHRHALRDAAARGRLAARRWSRPTTTGSTSSSSAAPARGRRRWSPRSSSASSARALGLPVPELVLVELDPALGRAEPDPEIQELIARQRRRRTSALDFLPGALPYSPGGAVRARPGARRRRSSGSTR